MKERVFTSRSMALGLATGPVDLQRVRVADVRRLLNRDPRVRVTEVQAQPGVHNVVHHPQRGGGDAVREPPTRPRTTKPNGRQPRHALSTAFVRDVARAGRYCDGDGLYLDVQPTGTRSWVQRLVIRGRRRELGLGGFPLGPLKDARAQALANRRLARAGGDPLAEKRRLKSMPTFAAAAEAVCGVCCRSTSCSNTGMPHGSRPRTRR